MHSRACCTTQQYAVQTNFDACAQAAESTRQRLARKLIDRKTQQLQRQAASLAADTEKGGSYSPLSLRRLRFRIACFQPKHVSSMQQQRLIMESLLTVATYAEAFGSFDGFLSKTRLHPPCAVHQ